MPDERSDKFISWINAQKGLGWQADTCKLTKKHAGWDPVCSFQEMKFMGLSQVRSRSKAKSKAREFDNGSEDFKAALAQAQSFMKKYETSDDIPDDEVPDAYSFSSIQGFDFTGTMKD